MFESIRSVIVAGTALLLLSGLVAGVTPTFDITHEHTAHEAALKDVEFDDKHQITYSLDEEGNFVAYDVQAAEVAFSHPFEVGHALAIGEDVVYVAVADTLWVYDVAAGNLSELTTLDDHPGDMVYDEARNVVWIAGHETVYGYDADDGSEYMNFTEHSDGLGAIDVQGDYVASGTQFASEVVVYDVAEERVAYEPELPDDVKSIGALDLTENGDLIVGTAADDGDVIAAYDVGEREQRLQYRKHVFGVSYVEYESTTDQIISTGFDNTVKIYDVSEGAVVAKYQHADTIYTADLDLTNALLWIGDGEERTGTVTGLDLEEETAGGDSEQTDEATPAEESMDENTPAAESTDAAANGAATPTDDSAAVEDPETTEAEGTGFGPLVAIAAVLGLTGLVHRRRS